MSLVKVSIENIDSNDKNLHEIDMRQSFEDNIKAICEIFQKHYSPGVYGLKLISTNDGKTLHTYISSDNFNEIKDGYFLKLVFSINNYVNRIFAHINDDYKERSFIDLYELSVDPEFIKELGKIDAYSRAWDKLLTSNEIFILTTPKIETSICMKKNKHHVILDVFVNSDLNDKEATACLIAIVHLFQKLYITDTDISQAFLDKVIATTKTCESDELRKYCLSVIHKILCHRDPGFAKWKQETIKQMTIDILMEFIKKKNSDSQYGAILVINALIRCCKGDKRQQLIKEIDKKSCKLAIYENVIESRKIEKNMAHELYLYQTYLLSQLADTLNGVVDCTTEMLSEFAPVDNEVKKMTLLMDFEEVKTQKAASFDSILEHDNARISLASMSSKFSEDESRYSSRIQSITTSEGEYEILKPSLLTLEALRHYRKHHHRNFLQSQVEETAYEPGILASSERVIRMLAKILNIGTDPDRNSTCYQPSIFNCSSRTPFFFELFSRTMWLLSKTRREMKAYTMQDYDKVINVLTRQVRLVLDKKALDLKKLTEEFVNVNYDTVMKIWEKEREEELKSVLENNPSVAVLKSRYSKENETNIYKHRIDYIRNGTLFPKFNDKKINGNFFAKLSNDGRNLLINDVDVSAKTKGEVKPVALKDVTHIIVGKACPHVINNSVKDSSVAFSIIADKIYYNFKAADRKSASYWVDALNLLLNKDNRSLYYKQELEELTQMDLVLHLMELQNVTIPKKAPPVPKDPFEIKPNLPPKPPHLSKK